jgi:hypothetical protein
MGLGVLLGISMLPALLRTSAKRSAEVVTILNATGSTHVNFSMPAKKSFHAMGESCLQHMKSG